MTEINIIISLVTVPAIINSICFIILLAKDKWKWTSEKTDPTEILFYFLCPVASLLTTGVLIYIGIERLIRRYKDRDKKIRPQDIYRGMMK